MKAQQFILSLLLGLLCFNNTSAQTYRPILQDANQWNVLWQFPDFISTEVYSTGNEVSYQGMNFLPIYRNAPSQKFLGFLREDSANQKVYFYDQFSYPTPNLDSERLLYDFDIDVGDTVDIFYRAAENNTKQPISLVVDSIGFGDKFNDGLLGPFSMPPLIDDSARVFNLQPVGPTPTNHSERSITWVEGVGSVAGPMRSGMAGGLYLKYDLVCFHQNEQLEYYSVSNPNFDSDSCVAFVSLEAAEKKSYHIYPNPTVESFIIEHNHPIASFQIYNTKGQMVDQAQEVKDTKLEINLADLPKGIYFIRLQLGETVASEKIILVD